MSWSFLLTQATGWAIAALTGGAVVAAINAVAGKRKVKVEAVDLLNDSTLEWAKELKADASSARAEAAGAREEATRAHGALAQVRQEAMHLAWQLRVLNQHYQDVRGAILGPDASLETLRFMVSHEPGFTNNGST